MEFIYTQEAAGLPPEWDALAENYFQQQPFLIHTEKYNPCQQRYYLGFHERQLVSAAIVYSLRLDIFTYNKIKLPIKMHIVGIPCSVSSPGIFGDIKFMDALKRHIYEVEKGFVLVLNLKEKPSSFDFASGNTLPTIVLSNHFSTWDEYMAALRSDYRRRLKKINQSGEGLRLVKMKCWEFSEVMYRQYLDVYGRSNGKLEKLSIDFFRHLPPEFILTVCFNNTEVMGWNIALADKNTYFFFLGGIDYVKNKIYNTYFQLLFDIVRDGIEKKFVFIEMGQTAEIPKIRLGGILLPRYMEAHHSNVVFNKLLRWFGGMLVYKRQIGHSHPFKEEYA